MALHDSEEYHTGISISVEFTEEDLYGFSQTIHDDHVPGFMDSTNHTESGLLSPSFPSSASQSSESFSPSSESVHSFNSNIESIGSPLWYSPASSYQLSATSSPYSISDELEVTQSATVSPRDITSHPFDYSLWDSSGAHDESAGFIEPLFEESAEDTAGRELRAIDGLYGAQRVTDLHILIPEDESLSKPRPPLGPPSELPAQPYYDSPEHSHNKSSSAQPSGISTPHSPAPQSPSPSPNCDEPNQSRKRSHVVSGSVRVPTSPNRTSPRHHPYRPRAVSLSPNVQDSALEYWEDMTPEEFEMIKEIISQHPEFRDFNFDDGILPSLHKSIVGSDQTRKASQERRTDTTVFYCPIRVCGSTLTKRHNLKHHIESHYLPPMHTCQHCNHSMRHNASLKRHERSCGKKSPTVVDHPASKGKKRGKKH